ncbi:unnamed protein product [marine sediment metagenome]|uniref:Uncharacterized protein n=1 Tax=marine sediment metagenome TaxID=412755 RepID=X1A844_9ZZZZ
MKIYCNHCGKKVFAGRYNKRFCSVLCTKRHWDEALSKVQHKKMRRHKKLKGEK